MTDESDASSPTAIAAARAAGETWASIARRTGWSVSTVKRRVAEANQEQVLAGPPPGTLRGAPTSPARGEVASWGGEGRASEPDTNALLRRLYAALEAKMKIVEQRIAQNGGMSRMDSERDARTLNGLARLYDRLSEIAARAMAAGSGKSASAGGDDETERLRRDLAERLERLRGQAGG